MALLLREKDVDGVVSPELAFAAIKDVLELEVDGQTHVPARLTAAAPTGWLRLMPAFIGSMNGDGGTMGFKAMNLNPDNGVRYLVLLYAVESGELLAIMDAAQITRRRTAAVTAIAAEALAEGAPAEIGLFGSGYEAWNHLEALKALWPELAAVRVYSPRRERREAFAQRASTVLGLRARAVDDPRESAAAPVVVLATKNAEPVLDADWLGPETVVLSIGSTRLDLRELDERVFGRAEICLCDAPAQLLAESGDVKAAVAAGHLRDEQLIPLADVVMGHATVSAPARDLAIFKSVGTALHDLAVAVAVLERCRHAGLGLDVGQFPATH